MLPGFQTSLFFFFFGGGERGKTDLVSKLLYFVELKKICSFKKEKGHNLVILKMLSVPRISTSIWKCIFKKDI